MFEVIYTCLVLFHDGLNASEDYEDFDAHHTIEINLKNQNNNKVVDHLLETRIPNVYGLVIKGVDLFRNESKPFDIQMQLFFKDVMPKKLQRLALSADGNFKPKFSDKNVKQLCAALREKRIADHLILEGFDFTDAQFNEIIRCSSELSVLLIRNNVVKSVEADSDPNSTVPLEISLKPLAGSKTLSTIDLTNNGFPESMQRKLQDYMMNSKAKKYFKSCMVVPKNDLAHFDDGQEKFFNLEER